MRRALAAIFAVLAPVACAAQDAPAHVHKLDRILAEISGLEVAGPRTVFAHNDEVAIIHELDLESGKVVRAFAFGRPNAKGDFEGVARMGDYIYLVTSDGLIHEGAIADHAMRTDYNVYDTRLGDVCEIEGIAPDDDANGFFLLCKRTRDDFERKRLVIYHWRFSDRLADIEPFLDVPLDTITPAPESGHFKGADLKITASGGFLILDANEGALIEMTRDGALVKRTVLPGNHPQAEGLAVMPDGAVIIGDEGGKKKGRLTVYAAKRQPD